MKYNVEILRLLSVILITFTHTRHDLTGGFLYFILEDVPKVGTLLLSIISGYLFWTISKDDKNLIKKKIKSLIIPFLIANVVVLLPVVILHQFFNISLLSRLPFDYSLITNGLLSLNAAPVNPPTYFIRDIFVVFVMMELFRNRNFRMLIFLIPLMIFGELMLRYDILILFLSGAAFPYLRSNFSKKWMLIICVISLIFCYFIFPDWIKYPIALIIFILLIDVKIKFRKTGGFSYLLHLYHAPVIVLTYPLIAHYIQNTSLSIAFQLFAVFLSVSLLYWLTRIFPAFKY